MTPRKMYLCKMYLCRMIRWKIKNLSLRWEMIKLTIKPWTKLSYARWVTSIMGMQAKRGRVFLLTTIRLWMKQPPSQGMRRVNTLMAAYNPLIRMMNQLKLYHSNSIIWYSFAYLIFTSIDWAAWKRERCNHTNPWNALSSLQRFSQAETRAL